MAKTLYQKVFEAHVVHEAAGETPIIYIDRHLVHEVTSPQAFEGLRVAGRAPGTDLCEMIELPTDVHPWFVGCQFHPEFTSNPRRGHPLFVSFVRAALDRQRALLVVARDIGQPRRKPAPPPA